MAEYIVGVETYAFQLGPEDLNSHISVYAHLSWRQKLSIVLNLTWTDIVARYGAGTLGVAWLFLGPMLFFAVAFLIFGYGLGVSWDMGHLPAGHRFGAPFFLGYSCHILLSDGVSQSLSAFRRQRGIMRISNLPTPLVFISGFITSQIRGTVMLSIAIAYTLSLHVPSPTDALVGAFAVLLVMLFVAGVSSMLGSLVVFIPDLQFVMPALLRVTFYATPIIYPLSILPEKIQSLIMLNPMAVLVETLRHALLLGQEIPWTHVLAVLITGGSLLFMGYFVFRRINRFLHDLM